MIRRAFLRSVALAAAAQFLPRWRLEPESSFPSLWGEWARLPTPIFYLSPDALICVDRYRLEGGALMFASDLRYP